MLVSDIPEPDRVEKFRFGRFQFGDTTHKEDAIVRDGAVYPWRRGKGHRVTLADLDSLLESPPAMLVIGRGIFGLMKVPEETRLALAERGVQVIEARTGAAVETFNRLLDAGEDAALAMHLTC
jgi:hypothetical protein